MAVWERVAAGRDGGCGSGLCQRRGICVGGDESAETEGEEFISKFTELIREKTWG